MGLELVHPGIKELAKPRLCFGIIEPLPLNSPQSYSRTPCRQVPTFCRTGPSSRGQSGNVGALIIRTGFLGYFIL